MSVTTIGNSTISIKNGNIGIGTTNPTSALTLFGDTRISGAISGSVLKNTVDNNDLYSTFNTTNSATGKFLNWLTTVSNEAKRGWWSKATTPVFSTITASGTLIANGYTSGVLIPDGRVIFVPTDASTIGIFNPFTNLYSLGPSATGYCCGVLIPDGRVVCVPRDAANIGIYSPTTNSIQLITPGASLPGGVFSFQYQGGVLLPNGNVAFIPFKANNIGIFNPLTSTFSVLTTNVPTSTDKYQGGVLLPDGRVICVPFSIGTIGIYTPAADASGLGTFTNTSVSATGYDGGVLLPDGRVVFAPYTATTIGLYTPGTGEGTFTTASGITLASGDKYIGGTLLPDGTVLLTNWGGTDMRLYDPIANTTSIPITGITVYSYRNGVLIPDGRVICPPGNVDGKIGIVSGFSPVSVERCLHPCFNAF